MRHMGPSTHSISRPWGYAALTLVTLGVVAALAHQSEDQRLRQVEQDAVARLKADLDKALDFAFALQQASIRTPVLSSDGDTITFALPAPSGQVEELVLFVDRMRGGLCLAHADRPPELVATTVDEFKATLDRRSDGQPVLCVELSASQSKPGEPPLRQHLYRSIVVGDRPLSGDHA